MRWFLISIIGILFIGCAKQKESNLEKPENAKAKELLQGIWVDSDSNTPLMLIKGDSIHHTDPQNIPVFFKVVKDSFYLLGHTTSSYHIERQSENSFWFHSLSGNLIKLYKSENPNDSLVFLHKKSETIPIYSQVTKRDSIVYYKNTRYRAYVFINPATTKVFKTIYSEDGLGADNVYYDNIIHICVYKNAEKVYAKDVTKYMFDEIIPEDLLSKTILADMHFIHVSSSGFLFEANICEPESCVSQFIDLIVGFDGVLKICANTGYLRRSNK